MQAFLSQYDGLSCRELFEDFQRVEKDVLKKHKPGFKSLVKQKQIRF